MEKEFRPRRSDSKSTGRSYGHRKFSAGKAQDVRKEEVFITTEMTKVKAQRKDPAEVLAAGEVLEAHVMEVTDRTEVLEGRNLMALQREKEEK